VKIDHLMEFLLDENVLGLARFLENRVKYRKVGDSGCPAKEAGDPEIVQFAKENDLIIVTKDIKMIEECKFENLKYVTLDDADFAKKIVNYSNP
jgi:predicted nuclease of predicted toxin-antitoxin system